MASHQLRIDASEGTEATIYVAVCLPCRWLSDDRPTGEAARQRFREHVSGELDRLQPKTNMMGPAGE